MEFSTTDGLLIVGAYLLGAVPFGYLIGQAKGVDIRTQGSGNIGATNLGRVVGKKWGIFCFLLDVGKGFGPALAARMAHWGEAGVPPAVAIVGLAAIVGHVWPVYLKFKGGKGVATSCGVFLALFPLGVMIALGVWAVTVAVMRYISLGSMLGGVALLVCALVLQEYPLGKEGIALTLFAGLAAVLSVVRHRGNIARLLKGAEPKIGECGEARHTKNNDNGNGISP